jgi:hypothetical protein
VNIIDHLTQKTLINFLILTLKSSFCHMNCFGFQFYTKCTVFGSILHQKIVKARKVVKAGKVIKAQKVVQTPKMVQLENLRLLNTPLLVHFCSKCTNFGVFLQQMWCNYHRRPPFKKLEVFSCSGCTTSCLYTTSCLHATLSQNFRIVAQTVWK